MTDQPAQPSLEEIRARKAAVKAANLERIQKEVEPMLKPLPENLPFNELQMEHSRLRQKITEIQTLTIQGQFDFQKSLEFEKVIVEQIHRVEERARLMSSGQYVPKKGE